MLLRSLRLQGFKKFKDASLVFAKGLNVICGPNEIGKTTIHQAVLTAFYGLGARVTGLLREDVEHWGESGLCRVLLEYQVGSQLYAVERDIKKKAVFLKRFDPKDHLYTVFNEDSKSIQSFIDDQLGIDSPEVFKNTVSVNQTELVAASENLSAVSQNIERVFTGRSSVSPEEILENLSSMRKKLKKNRNEKSGKIDLLQEEYEKNKQQLVLAQQQEQERKDLEARVINLEISINASQSKLKQLESLLDKSRSRQMLEKRLKELRKQYQAFQYRLDEYEKALKNKLDAQEELQEYKGILSNRSSIDEFSYFSARMASIDSALESLMHQRVDASTRGASLHSPSVMRTLRLVLFAVLLIDFFSVLYSLFTGQFQVFTAAVGIGFVLLAALIVLTFRERKQPGVSDFNRLAIERKELKEKLDAFLMRWGFSSNYDYKQVAEMVKKLKLVDEMMATSELQIRTIMGSDTVKQIEDEKEEAALEIVGLKQQLSQLEGYEPPVEQVQQWEHEYQEAIEQLPKLREEMYTLQGRIQELKKQYTSVAEILSQGEFLQHAIQELEFEHKAILLAVDQFREVIDNFNAVYLPQLSQKASEYFYGITNGKYKTVDLSRWPTVAVSMRGYEGFNQNKTKPSFLSKRNSAVDDDSVLSKKINPQSLSQGTIDQLYFSLRVSASELLSKQTPLPLFLDDPFTHFDKQRLTQALKILLRISQQHQVLYFTHDAEVGRVLESLDRGSHDITLIALE
ncbi:MAG: AAA family ATPase [bacterium]